MKINNNHYMLELLECITVFISVNLAYIISALVIYELDLPIYIKSGLLGTSTIGILTVLIFGSMGYFSLKEKSLVQRISMISVVVISIEFFFVAFLYFFESTRFNIYLFVISGLLQIILLTVFKKFFTKIKAKITSAQISVAIGYEATSALMIECLERGGVHNLYFLDANTKNIYEQVANSDNLYLSVDLPFEMKQKLVTLGSLMNQEIFLVPETYEISMRKSRLTQVGGLPVFLIDRYRLSFLQQTVKRLFDIIVGIIGIICCIPIFIMLAAIIKLEDNGPIFYFQERVGCHKRSFNIIKFRSMIVDAEEQSGAVFAVKDDPRITKIGRIMRRFGLDELPQLFNVIHGEMSLIGPRPERPNFVEQFQDEVNQYAVRLSIKPGITGLAQVQGTYTTPPEDKLRLDMIYIKEYSWILDVKIIFLTIRVIFSRVRSQGFSNEYKVVSIAKNAKPTDEDDLEWQEIC
jgi:exopolysaccharide biosynthesis polyprenyl glycosylphosphotransferase